MTNITKEQLKIIIKETIKISKEDSFLKVIYDDKWKEDKKLAEKVNKTGIDTNDIVCVISELFDMVIFKKNTIWLSSSKKEYDYSNLLLAYSVYDKKHNCVEKNKLYIAYEEDNIKCCFFNPVFDETIIISTINEIIKTEKELTDQKKLIDYYLDLCTKKVGFHCCYYCAEQIKKYGVMNDEIKKLIGFVESAKLLDFVPKTEKKAKSRENRNIPIILTAMTYQIKKNIEKTEVLRKETFIQELIKNEESLSLAMRYNCFEGYLIYFSAVYKTLFYRSLSSNPNSDSEFVLKAKRNAEELYTKLERGECLYVGARLFANAEDKSDDERFFLLFDIIGNIYYNYIVDKEKAWKWFEKARELDVPEDMKEEPDIMYKLAMLFKAGDGGLVRSNEMMEHYLKKGAKHNHGLCELELAEFYRQKKDFAAAEEWKKRAKAHGVESEEDKQRRHQKYYENICKATGIVAEGVAIVAGVKKIGKNNEK